MKQVKFKRDKGRRTFELLFLVLWVYGQYPSFKETIVRRIYLVFCVNEECKTANCQMFFRLKYIVKSIDLGGHEKIEWESDELKYPTSFIVRPLSEEEIKQGVHKNDLICTVTSEHLVPEHDLTIYENIQSEIPATINAFVDEMLDHLHDHAIRTIEIFIWMRGIFHHKPIRYFRGYQYSFDKQHWKSFPGQVHFEIVHISPPIDKSVPEAFVQQAITLTKNGQQVPLSHNLFSEAWELASGNPRSSLVIAVAAAETAVKNCIGELIPAGQQPMWYKKNKQSPPLINLLNVLLPAFHAKAKIKGKVLRPPPSVLDTLGKGIKLRNKIVHGQALPIDQEMLQEILYAIRDLLLLMDYYCGFTWAEKYIRPSTVRELINSSKIN